MHHARTLTDIAAFARREGPAMLARHDEAWFRAQRTAALERSATALVALAGLLLLGWPAAPLAVLLLVGQGAVLVRDAVCLWLHGDAIRAARNERRHEAEVEAALRELVAGATPAQIRSDAALPGPMLEFAMAAWLYGCMVASVVWEIREQTGVSLVQTAMQAPDMLVVMALTLAWQVASVVPRAGAAAREVEDYAPLLDAVVWFLALFFWVVVGGICAALAELPEFEALAGQGITVLVIAGHGVFFLRGVLELRALAARRHELAAARRWLVTPPDA
ncbi:MAG: hypothetical protein RLW61_08775 [Gammaproteobacteria bacterium]